MTEKTAPTAPKWPFFLVDAFMLGLAWFIHWEARLPLDHFTVGAICVCVTLGAISSIAPFIMDYRAALKSAETDSLHDAVSQIKNLEGIAGQISFATSQWQTVQDSSMKAVAAANEIGTRMTSEANAFAESMQRANDTEKATLRLETEKLRRAENDWLQVIVVMLDHTYGLHCAVTRTGKTGLAEPITQFQNALRDAARRVGLTPFVPTAGDDFEEKRHQSNGAEQPEPGAKIAETVACGYTFRGQLIRPALVKIAAATPAPTEPEHAPTPSAPATPASEKEPTLL
ncbi:MAG: hypothetical protein RLY20_986 [Verrucomicrobiota bacterium]|jgi:molecular chaperone GrpE (heat shock protein)